ncbi:hypothetical protein ACWD4F_27895 [Streptomyces aureus]
MPGHYLALSQDTGVHGAGTRSRGEIAGLRRDPQGQVGGQCWSSNSWARPALELGAVSIRCAPEAAAWATASGIARHR